MKECNEGIDVMFVIATTVNLSIHFFLFFPTSSSAPIFLPQLPQNWTRCQLNEGKRRKIPGIDSIGLTITGENSSPSSCCLSVKTCQRFNCFPSLLLPFPLFPFLTIPLPSAFANDIFRFTNSITSFTSFLIISSSFFLFLLFHPIPPSTCFLVP